MNATHTGHGQQGEVGQDRRRGGTGQDMDRAWTRDTAVKPGQRRWYKMVLTTAMGIHTRTHIHARNEVTHAHTGTDRHIYIHTRSSAKRYFLYVKKDLRLSRMDNAKLALVACHKPLPHLPSSTLYLPSPLRLPDNICTYPWLAEQLVCPTNRDQH